MVLNTTKGTETTNCPNCGHPLQPSTAFCPACGQKNTRVRIGLREILYDFFSGLLNLDNKILKTLLALWIPGKLTRLFFAGKRISYTHPLRLYLFISFILFAIIGYQFNQTFKQSSVAETLDTRGSQQKKADMRLLDSLSQQLGQQNPSPDIATGARVLMYLFALDTFSIRLSDTLQMELSSLTLNTDPDSTSWRTSDIDILVRQTPGSPPFEATLARADRLFREKNAPDSLSINLSWLIKNPAFNRKIAIDDLLTLEDEVLYEKYGAQSFFSRLFISQAAKITKNPASALYYILSGFSWIALLFIPFMALWQALIYVRKKFYYVEHLVFTAHATSLFFLLLILLLTIHYLFQAEQVYLILIGYPLYLLVAHKSFYRQGWIKTFLKWFIGLHVALLLILLLTLLSILVRMVIY
jgi:hypothetical protein